MSARICFIILALYVMAGCTSVHQPAGNTITTGHLLDEMADLERLVSVPELPYRTLQFSSYDRTSVSMEDSGWFSNSDGFGGEQRPGFEQILQEPGPDGIGTYLICDIRQAGAILRLWTAGINGKIKLFLDNDRKPVFEGEAKDFFWNAIRNISDTTRISADLRSFRQFDAVYFPIPFSKGCRIEWTGNISDIHFYHVTVRVYKSGIAVRTFDPSDIISHISKVQELCSRFEKNMHFTDSSSATYEKLAGNIPGKTSRLLFKTEGSRAITLFCLKIKAAHIEKALRSSILNIYFDNSSVPQVHSPVGDFFGSAPGINPFNSLPFTVQSDSMMICRFIMPFKKAAKIEIENTSDAEISVTGKIRHSEFEWTDGNSMYFNAQWSINHGLTASDTKAFDIPYIMASGKGRIVGTAAFVYNPSNAVTSWGNWWGEGDEKVFVDGDTLPSIFGTGSEDYFNYSWSSERLFSNAYCGQTRNDGPGNRGYVSDYRWHILDDIPFQENCAFFMELLHHGVVDNFSYGRIVYFYALPGVILADRTISVSDVADIQYRIWEPAGYLGSAGYDFLSAEDAVFDKAGTRVENGDLWAGGSILMWEPVKENQSLQFRFMCNCDTLPVNLGLTLAHMPGGGEISIMLNGNRIKLDGRESVKLEREHHAALQNHFTEKTYFKKGANELQIVNKCLNKKSKIGIDFIWIKDCVK